MSESAASRRTLSLLDGTLLVVGSMIGSGVFIVSADMTRELGSAGWLMAAWAITGLMTLTAALSYGELSGMFPQAGGQYVYLREAYGKRTAFLYGWAFFAVIQTGTIAAVAVAFAKFLGYFVPAMGDGAVLFKAGGFSLTGAQVAGVGSVLLLTTINTRGVEAGRWIQGLFTFAKVAAIAALIGAGFFLARESSWGQNWMDAWGAKSLSTAAGSIHHEYLFGAALIPALCAALVGSLFSSDAWNSVTFIAGEMRRPERNIGLSLAIGTVVVTALYLTINAMYLHVLPLGSIARAPDDRVALAAATQIFGARGTGIIAVLVMISTFGCNNGLILSGARVYNTMARDGLFLPAAARLNRAGVPAAALWMQAIWASVLCLSGRYNELLNFVVVTVLLFYILTIGGVFILRRKRPDAHRPYKAFGYPVVPLVYMALAVAVCGVLLATKPAYSWPGLLIVLLGLPVYAVLQRRKAASSISSQ